MLKELNPLLHSQLRLAVMSILLSVDEADFVYLKEQTNATAGNLSGKKFCGQETSYCLPDDLKRAGSYGRICGSIERIFDWNLMALCCFKGGFISM